MSPFLLKIFKRYTLYLQPENFPLLPLMVEDYDEVTNNFAFLMAFLAVHGTMAKSILCTISDSERKQQPLTSTSSLLWILTAATPQPFQPCDHSVITACACLMGSHLVTLVSSLALHPPVTAVDWRCPSAHHSLAPSICILVNSPHPPLRLPRAWPSGRQLPITAVERTNCRRGRAWLFPQVAVSVSVASSAGLKTPRKVNLSCKT